MSANKLAQDVQTWINNWDAEGFGCACAPGVTCGTCQWRNRIRPLREALAAHQAHQAQQAQQAQEPVAWQVWWGLGKMRLSSVHLEKAAAEEAASRIRSYTEVRPLYTSPQPSHVPGWQLVPEKITEEQHVAACKVLLRANGLDGLPQRMLDAIRTAAPQQGDKTP